MRSLPAVFPSAHSICSTSSRATPSRRPMKRIRTPSSSSSGVSSAIRSPNIRINPSTSSRGRVQFSVEKEKTVSSSTPSSTASRSLALTTSAPAWCPAATGRPRCWAQRPLPSVMIATYLGAVTLCGPPSNLEDFLFLALQERVDLGDRVVGLLLQRGLGAALVVLAPFPLFLQFAQVVHDVAADVADRDPALLGDAVHHLDHLPPPLLGQLRDRQADHVAVVARGESDVGLLDRFLDPAQGALVEGGDGEQAGVGGGDVGQLLQRRRVAVVVDDDAVEQVRRGTAGAHGREFATARIDRLGHPTLGVLEQFVDQLHRFPSSLKRRARWRPGCPPSRRRRSYLCSSRPPC